MIDIRVYGGSDNFAGLLFAAIPVLFSLPSYTNLSGQDSWGGRRVTPNRSAALPAIYGNNARYSA